MRSLGFVVTLLALIALHGTARSQQPEQQSADAARQADEHFWKGKALLKAGNVRGAYEEYKAAFGLRKSFDAAANLGNLELSLGMPRDAAEHLAFSLRTYAPTGTTPATLERTRQLLAQARAQVATLTIQVNVDGAEVTIDGQVVGRSPIAEEVYVDPGSRTLEARLAAYPTARVTISAEKGASQQVALKLDAPAPPPTGSATTTPPPRRSRVPGVVLASVGGAALATGIGLYAGGRAMVASGADERDAILKVGHACVTGALNYDARCPEVKSTATTANALQKAGVGLMVGAGAAAVGTVIYFVVPTSSAGTKSSGLRVMPAVSPGNAGLVLSGSF
jgi:hypothetical protein